MSETSVQLLATFETLPKQEQHELMAEMLRRSGELPATLLTEDQLTDIADELFQALDAKESDGCNSDTK